MCDRVGHAAPRNPVVQLTRHSRDMQLAFHLLPDGYGFEIFSAKPDGKGVAVLFWKQEAPVRDRTITGQGRTVPLAMCSAALQASSCN